MDSEGWERWKPRYDGKRRKQRKYAHIRWTTKDGSDGSQDTMENAENRENTHIYDGQRRMGAMEAKIRWKTLKTAKIRTYTMDNEGWKRWKPRYDGNAENSENTRICEGWQSARTPKTAKIAPSRQWSPIFCSYVSKGHKDK
jgi:hypothetical protein